ncbi:sigma 54-interacting transcriptional regulator [candidate division KSB1 bacterium]|nr:sigma 54-interacting transcriptional regulator [candidate division KSB1 bacterium]
MMTPLDDKSSILIVDDTPSNISVLVDYLSEAGFKVLVARDGESAIEQVHFGMPDLVLLDVVMPGIDGFETCRRLKAEAQTKDIPVIFMTALSETVEKVKGFNAGAVDFITKPIQHEEVLARVTAHLTIRKLQQRLQEARDQLELRVRQRTAELAEANAKLQKEIAERTKAEKELRAITAGTAAVTGTEFFHSLVKHLAEAFHVRYAFVAECTDAAKTAVRTVSFLENKNICENFTYALEGTPCEKVINGQAYYHPEKLYATFPKEAGMESYLGVPIHDSKGRIIGHLAILHDQPMETELPGLAIMKIFAARAGAELERKRAEEALQTALREVEELKNRLQAENIYLQEEIKTAHNFEEIVGASSAIKKVFQNIEKVAATDSTVLVTGETGTGKELVARALHTSSRRKDSVLIKVNCAALPVGLIESELFGHEKGAFTGATVRKKGRFELADGGTIFLDEVGDLPLETQVKLLRVLQEQEFERVGGAQTLKVNVRVIAATNRNLEDAVKHGTFRVDLFYRLNIFPIHLPALHERREDIPILAKHFVGKFARRMGKRVEHIAPDAMERLMRYHWPGNVREMANLLERAVILCDGSELQAEHIGITPQPLTSETEISTLEETERLHILKALKETNGVVGGQNGAAKLLGLNRTTLLARMKKLGIEKNSQ